MNLKKMDLHPSIDFETTTEHYKNQVQNYSSLSEQPRQKILFILKERKSQCQGNTQIKSFLSIKRSNYYCQDDLLCGTSTLKRGCHLGKFQLDGEGNLEEMSAIKTAFSTLCNSTLWYKFPVIKPLKFICSSLKSPQVVHCLLCTLTLSAHF